MLYSSQQCIHYYAQVIHYSIGTMAVHWEHFLFFCVSVCLPVWVWLWLCVCVCMCIRACMWVCVYICVWACLCLCVCVCICVCACVVFHGSSFCISCILWFSGKYLNNYALAQSGVNVSHVPPGWSKWFGLVGNR